MILVLAKWKEDSGDDWESFYLCFFQAYRLEPLISEDYCSIPPVQLPRYDSKQTADVKPGKTRATGKWGGLFASYRVGFAKQKPEAEEADDRSAGANTVENGDEDEVVIVHNATAADNIGGTNFFYNKRGSFVMFIVACGIV